MAAARSDAVAAEARQQAALLASVRVIADGQAALAAATRRQAVLETRTVPQASQALDLARQGFEAGKFGLLDVLDAQNALSDAQNDLIEARLARVQAQAALERAAR
ncbi:TolC family protein [Caulobacter sp. SSI4214]|uniref:TolC family protein n=1 Tax=Caulobacter sp. SSI4214 TaxID=2575739 RepID=UPI001439301C|nr:TolC family protein [Caulobacter sp. SSI4214]